MLIKFRRYPASLRTGRTDYLKEGLFEFLKKGPRDLDECVLEGAEILKRMGHTGAYGSDDFRVRVFEKLHQLKAIGFIEKDRSVRPHLYEAITTCKS